MLAHLMRRRGSVCRRDELLHDIWGMDFDPGSNVVDVCIRRLRNRLAGPPIETVRGVGYCFYGAMRWPPRPGSSRAGSCSPSSAAR